MSHWALLGGSLVVGLAAALVSGYVVVMIPLARDDRFALAAMSIPSVWVLVCLHIMLSSRPARWSVGYAALSAVALTGGYVYGAFA